MTQTEEGYISTVATGTKKLLQWSFKTHCGDRLETFCTSAGDLRVICKQNIATRTKPGCSFLHEKFREERNCNIYKITHTINGEVNNEG